MEIKKIIIGFLIGLVLPVVGAYVFLELFSDMNLFRDYNQLSQFGMLSKVLTLGALLNLAVFSLFFYTKRDAFAKGILAATLVLGCVTFFI